MFLEVSELLQHDKRVVATLTQAFPIQTKDAKRFIQR